MPPRRNVRTQVWPQRWLQFSLRSFLIAIVLIVLPLSWLGRGIGYVSKQQRAASEIMEKGGGVRFNYEDLSAPIASSRVRTMPAAPSKNRVMTWLDEKVLAEAIGVVGTGKNIYGIAPLADVPSSYMNTRTHGFSERQFEFIASFPLDQSVGPLCLARWAWQHCSRSDDVPSPQEPKSSRH
ncbi:MAG: hypothetical protein QGG71_22155 [Pirellulaceae bacterium]|jgi:hypothetical protein|nr:hypothetical protein [Pirellulaceae bacterium]